MEDCDKKLLNRTGDVEETRYMISTKWKEGEERSERTEEAEEVGEEMRKGTRPMRSTTRNIWKRWA